MPTLKFPLAGSYNQRTIDGTSNISKDQRFVNCVFEAATNPVTRTIAVYASKRPGWGVSGLIEAGSPSTALIQTDSFNSVISAFGATNSTIYKSTVSVGAITGLAIHFYETLLGGIGYILIRSTDGTAWYFAADAANTLAYTCDGNNSTTITDLKVAGVASVSGLYVGQKLTAASNIVAGSRIVSINAGAFSAVLDTATTGGAFNDLATTKEPIAKIQDADFVTSGTTISSFVDIDGFVFYCTADGYLYGSDLNSVTAYSASNKIAANMSPDLPIAVARLKNYVVCFNTNSTEYFYNAGNPSGSPLSRVENLYTRVGALAQRSVVQIEDDIYFVSSSRNGSISVMKLGQKEPISTSFIDNILGTAAAAGAEIYLSAFTLDGNDNISVVVLSNTVPTNSFMKLESDDFLLLESSDKMILEGDSSSVSASFLRMFLYNTKVGLWSEWDTPLATYITGTGTGSLSQIIASSRVNTSGKVYRINPTSDGELHTDDGTAFTMSAQFQTDMGTDTRKFGSELRIVGDTQSSGSISISWSDDDGANFTTPRTISLTSQRKKLSALGSWEGSRLWKLEDAGNNANRIKQIEIDYELAE